MSETGILKSFWVTNGFAVMHTHAASRRRGFLRDGLGDQGFQSHLCGSGRSMFSVVFARDQTKAESIASRLVFRGVGKFQMIGERVFLRHIIFRDGFELWPFRREFRKIKPAPFLEADEKDAFAVLRHDARASITL